MLLRIVLYAVMLAVGGLYFFYDDSPEEVHTLPPIVSLQKLYQDPIQTPIKPFTKRLDNGDLEFVDEYEITGRVLSIKEYHTGENDPPSPLDIALGWRRMSDPGLVGKMSLSQVYRAYKYKWDDSMPLTLLEVRRTSANVHLIPANEAVALQLKDFHKNQVVTLKGFLANYQHRTNPDVKLTTSKLRTDTGKDSGEVLYVEHVVAYPGT